ncbi:hypothetical protein CSB09_02210 [Candidatus Gracilibacteria bacterium]|nr:MAG: hypothetical protein CSB09_02210 [Candidatus Gracilibacteria bacterium]
MLKIFNFFRLKSFQKSIIRFPIAAFVVLCLSLSVLSLIWFFEDAEFAMTIARFALSASIVFFLSIGAQLSSEAGKWNLLIHIVSQILVLMFGVFFFSTFHLDSSSPSFLYYILVLVAIMGYVFFAPHVRRLFSSADSNKLYYPYFLGTLFAFMVSLVFGIVFVILGLIALHSTFFLFNISDYILLGKLSSSWMVIGCLFLAPLFGMSRIPDKDHFYELVHYKKQAWHFMVEYLFLPFTVIYFLILYSYSIFVLADFGNWPRGIISWMVIGFSTLGYFTYILSYSLQENHKYIALFRKFFPWVVIPQLGMLFYAIYLRIHQFDLTINRYLVVLFGIWLLIVSLYLVFSRRKFLAFIPLFLTTLILIFSVGPWSVFELPGQRQLDRLKENLTQANMLENGKIIPPTSVEHIDKKILTEIYEGVRYLCYSHNCLPMKGLFPDIFEQNTQKKMNRWKIQNDITTLLKVSHGEYMDQKNISYMNIRNSQIETVIDISKYEKMFQKRYQVAIKKDVFFIDQKEQKLKVFDSDGNEDAIDISHIFKKLLELAEKQNFEYGPYDLQANLNFEIANKNTQYLLIFDNVSFRKKGGEWNVEHIGERMLLIGEKQ